MMNKKQFKSIADEIVEVYGVRSYQNNIEEDMTEDEIFEDLWFETPCCGDVIGYDDVDDEWTVLLKRGICPICENHFDEE